MSKLEREKPLVNVLRKNIDHLFFYYTEYQINTTLILQKNIEDMEEF